MNLPYFFEDFTITDAVAVALVLTEFVVCWLWCREWWGCGGGGGISGLKGWPKGFVVVTAVEEEDDVDVGWLCKLCWWLLEWRWWCCCWAWWCKWWCVWWGCTAWWWWWWCKPLRAEAANVKFFTAWAETICELVMPDMACKAFSFSFKSCNMAALFAPGPPKTPFGSCNRKLKNVQSEDCCKVNKRFVGILV